MRWELLRVHRALVSRESAETDERRGERADG
jgi:hypothetical protein